jgi:hypothetical protein
MKSRGIGSREISAARIIPSSLPRDTEGGPIADMQIGTAAWRFASKVSVGQIATGTPQGTVDAH